MSDDSEDDYNLPESGKVAKISRGALQAVGSTDPKQSLINPTSIRQ